MQERIMDKNLVANRAQSFPFQKPSISRANPFFPEFPCANPVPIPKTPQIPCKTAAIVVLFGVPTPIYPIFTCNNISRQSMVGLPDTCNRIATGRFRFSTNRLLVYKVFLRE
jgi:hypothetical protein